MNTETRSWTPFEADIMAIGKLHPTIQDAKPYLRALSFHRRCRQVVLIWGFLELFPNQAERCTTCRTLTPYTELVKGKCFDCIATEYADAASL